MPTDFRFTHTARRGPGPTTLDRDEVLAVLDALSGTIGFLSPTATGMTDWNSHLSALASEVVVELACARAIIRGAMDRRC